MNTGHLNSSLLKNILYEGEANFQSRIHSVQLFELRVFRKMLIGNPFKNNLKTFARDMASTPSRLLKVKLFEGTFIDKK